METFESQKAACCCCCVSTRIRPSSAIKCIMTKFQKKKQKLKCPYFEAEDEIFFIPRTKSPPKVLNLSEAMAEYAYNSDIRVPNVQQLRQVAGKALSVQPKPYVNTFTSMRAFLITDYLLRMKKRTLLSLFPFEQHPS